MKTTTVISIVVVVSSILIAAPLVAPEWNRLQEVSQVCGTTKPESRTPEQKELCKPGEPLFGGVIIPGLL